VRPRAAALPELTDSGLVRDCRFERPVFSLAGRRTGWPSPLPFASTRTMTHTLRRSIASLATLAAAALAGCSPDGPAAPATPATEASQSAETVGGSAPLASVAFPRTWLCLYEGAGRRLPAELTPVARDAAGHDLPAPADWAEQLTLASSDPSVLALWPGDNIEPRLAGTAVGTAVLTASYQGTSATATVWVVRRDDPRGSNLACR